MSERIKAAAIAEDDGTYKVGRHHDDIENGAPESKRKFLTTEGRIVDRAEAYQIAKREGQLKDPANPGPDLYSEDVNLDSSFENSEQVDLSSKTVLVVCNPLFVSMAERLAKDFGKTLLHVPHGGSFPTVSAGMVGYGLPGVELVDSVFGPHFEKVDLFVFVDLGHAALQIQLEKMGKRVFGTRNGEEMEVYREVCKRHMESLGLPVQPWRIVKGITALREYLKGHEKVHIKINRWRGLTESFFSPCYDVVETKLDAIAHDLGAFKETLEFIVEDNLPDCVEIGTDTICIDGAYPETTLIGLEIKDQFYAGMITEYSRLHPVLTEWNNAMAPAWAEYGYRCSLSNELRITDDLKAYCIDATTRAPSPPSELWQALFTNLSEIFWYGAEGIVVEPKPAAKWGVEVILKSPWAKEHTLPIDFDPKYTDQIKIYNCAVIDGRRYSVSQNEDMAEVGAVVGWGDTLQEALDHCSEAGETIKAYGVSFKLGGADEATAQMEKLEELGINPFDVEKKA
jgi:hypothetical protein